MLNFGSVQWSNCKVKGQALRINLDDADDDDDDDDADEGQAGSNGGHGPRWARQVLRRGAEVATPDRPLATEETSAAWKFAFL